VDHLAKKNISVDFNLLFLNSRA